MPPLPAGASAGALVVARSRRWRLEACVDRTDCRELHLRAAAGAERRILLLPFDHLTVVDASRPLRVCDLRAWSRHAGAALGRQADPLLPRVSFNGDVLSYQLAPVVAMAAGAPRILLADEVGLGKTIQAGWILADLLAREPDARALIAVPAGLRDQWWSELASFFAVQAARVNAPWLRAAVAGRPGDVSPWAAPGAYLGSLDFLKRVDVARSLAAVTWDLLVVDEAHAATAPTERHAALAAIAAVSRRVVVITATPFSGDYRSFASVTSLGAVAGEPPPLMFRRSRDEVGDRRKRRHRFLTLRIGRPEFRLQRLLERYTGEVWRDAPADVDGARLAMTVLRKRALSCPAAALRSLSRRLDLLRGAVPAPRQLSLFDEEPEADDTLQEGALATPGMADGNREQRWLAALVDAARRAAASDSKQRLLLRLLARIPGEAVIVFTEYRDTLRQLAGALPAAWQLHGGLTDAERAGVQRRFNEQGGILLATDAAAEGLNLQRRCRLLVNYELPWNPARLEQRIGRVDRIGQRRTVHAISLVARDTAEDLVVAGLTRRLTRVAATLGERDRLAAFLTDARTARAVIGGSPLELTDDGPEAPLLPRAAAEDASVARVAAILSAGDLGAAPSRVTAIARLRDDGILGSGFVAVVRAVLATDSGTVAERAFLFQLTGPVIAQPRTHEGARELVAPLVGPLESRAAAAPESSAGWRR